MLDTIRHPLQAVKTLIGHVTPVGWIAPAVMTYDEWEAYGLEIAQVNHSINWIIGDWLNAGEERFGDMAAQAWDIFGFDYSKLSQLKWVSSRIMLTTRVVDISWTMHREVASLPPDEQEHWLNRAANFGWSSRQLKQELTAHKQQQIQASNGYHKPAEPANSDYDDGADYLAALWSADGDSGDVLPLDDSLQQVACSTNGRSQRTPLEMARDKLIMANGHDVTFTSAEVKAMVNVGVVKFLGEMTQ